ncbi:hypothetical protein KY308_04530, partial [Candidatus Woesearchaeota archaeon]|nr:hypothetical protein [Candidatus Woesearchaeota archaeon]
MRKVWIVLLLVLLCLTTVSAVSSSSENNWVTALYDFLKGSITGFTGFPGSSSGGMNLTIWDEADTGGEPYTSPPKHRNDTIIFFANLTNATDGTIIDIANVSINISGFFSGKMTFNYSRQLWTIPINIYINDTNFDYNVTASHGAYSPASVVANDTVNVSQLCGDFTDNYYVNGDTVLCRDYYYPVSDSDGNGLIIINASNIVLDLNGSRFFADGIGMGINNTNFANVTIRNGGFVNFSKGVYLEYADFSNLSQLTFINNFNDITLNNSDNATIVRVSAANSSNVTVYFVNVTGSRISNSTFNSKGMGINLINSSNNYLNNITVLPLGGDGSLLTIPSGSYNNVINNSYLYAGVIYRKWNLNFSGSVNTTLENSY